MIDIARIKKLLNNNGLDAWLFFNFQHQDKITEVLLELSPEFHNTRPWYYIIPEKEPCMQIIHTIESSNNDHNLPGQCLIYTKQAELIDILKNLAGKYKKIAVQMSEFLPQISSLNAGTKIFLEKCGFSLFSSADLMTSLYSLTENQIQSHFRTAANLRKIIDKTFYWIKNNIAKTIYETDCQDFINMQFEKAGLITEHPQLVACGPNSANPHYIPNKSYKKQIKKNSIIQFDIYAKEKNGIYADISWVGYTGKVIPEPYERMFSLLKTSRDKTVIFISEYIKTGKLCGNSVDNFCRSIIEENGWGDHFIHRTGHSIDQSLHGRGANIDGYEFNDIRSLKNNICFSIEPGIYFKDDYGMRTEINIVLRDHMAVVSGQPIQNEIMYFQD